MPDAGQIIKKIFSENNIPVPKNRSELFESFLKDEQNIRLIQNIIDNQNFLMDKWKIENRVAEITQQSVRILNATVGKSYEARIDFKKLNWGDISEFAFEGLEELGLAFDEKAKQLTGIPLKSGEFKVVFKFKIAGELADSPFHEKIFPLIINPDPRSLWKNIESDKNDPYWKEDDKTEFAPLGDRHIIVSSKRGRSHANVGSFREDDYTFKDLANGWSLVVVADGAGSAKYSRKGSQLSCNAVAEYFGQHVSTETFAEFDAFLGQYKSNTGEDIQKKLNNYVYNNLGKAAFYVHKKLEEFSGSNSIPLKDLNSTLAFILIKKYDIGYAFLSFGVGDCPIGILNEKVTEVTLMNWLDVGEFGGGTRFITMAEIFKNEKFATRFGFKLIEDFSYVMLMSDGIYDAKFVVETQLANLKKWKELLEDLGGKNEEGIRVDLDPKNKDITSQFSNWMDFWSQGNHDDRTLAIVF